MNQEIKARIEQIKRGEVPEGYKKGKIGIVPTEWFPVNFSTLFTSTSDYTNNSDEYPLYSLTIENGITAKTDRYERSHLVKKENAYKIVNPNDYAFNPMNIRFGAVARHKGDIPVSVSGYYDIFTTIQPKDLEFMDSFLTCDSMLIYYNKVSTGSLVEKQRVHFSQFIDFNIELPSLRERKKIADILTTQDKVIELKEKLIAEKQQQKKWLMQNLLTGKIRLKGFSDEWKKTPIGFCLEQRVERQTPNEEIPLMAFTAKGGIESKGDRYDRSFLVKSDDKLYKRTFLYDFIYSSNNLDVGSIGLNLYGDAVISDVYEIFKVKDTAIPIIIDGIIRMPRNINKMIRFRQGVIYGQYRIHANDFLGIDIILPPLHEQIAISEILSTADREIELLQKDLVEEKQKKKALMQLLLTGILRCKTEVL